VLLHKYLEKNSNLYAHKTAIKCMDQSITYLQLDILSNQIAHSLLRQGIIPGDTVGIYLPKSIEAIAAIFGILKAGAVYVPIDSDSPLERVSYIMSDCSIKTIVLDELRLRKLIKNKKMFPEKWKILCVSNSKSVLLDIPSTWQLWSKEKIETQAKDVPQIEPRSIDDLAYILYTSGSTGQSKGVMLTHRNGIVFVEWAAQYLNLEAQDIFSSHAPIHFDLSIFDIFVSIKLAGTLCLIPPGISYFPDAILDFISRNKITVWYSVPSALIQLLSLKDDLKVKLQSITTLIYAGEVFPYTYLNQLCRVLDHAADIYNFYGPTETNVITYYQVKLNEPIEKNVPIGKPCPYAQIYVVDENKKTVEQGTVGELIVKGQSMMKGYWADPQKSDKAIQKVCLDNKEQFFYFTGDIVVEQIDGNLVYVNRRDNMVKTRGFRVELGEIETALYKNPLVYKTAVIAIPDERIGHRLIAFVVVKTDASLSIDEVNMHCSIFLPTYMIPEKIVFLPNMPITSNGKINREELKNMILQRN
jgi:amino acid adenylation domain-containing protein